MNQEKEKSVAKVTAKVTEKPVEKKVTVRGLVEPYILNTWRTTEEVVAHVLKTYADKKITAFTGNGKPVSVEKLKTEAKAVLTWMNKGLYKRLLVTHKFEKDEKTEKVRLIPK